MIPLLQAEALVKSWGGVRAVDEVSFTLAPGEMLALIGPNGAGKSTCFNLLNGQLQPDSGRVRLLGQDVTGLRPRAIWRLGVGRTFQVTATFGSMSVLDNVRMALLSHHRRLFGLWRPADQLMTREAEVLLSRVGMADQAARPSGVLAYGELKRLELAMALSNHPRLLLMDEPTAGMAPSERVALMARTAGIARDAGIAVLFTEHDMDVVFTHADRVLVLDRGRLIAAGAPEAVRADPLVRRIYLGGLADA
ncbi:ABC transporter ATP-binding protein [Pseudoroseomonas globiformis]|uniref:ABC transporter ATP-binding protein n=1 Tax=Teichococcus globiformis TaxID=2307229 RepID=A0ABV7FZ04_9PROT